MSFLFAALIAAGQVFAQQAAPAKTTEQQARSYVMSAFVTGAAPMVAPAPPQKLPEVTAQPAPPAAAPPPPAVEASKPAPVLQVVEPQVPRAVKPAAPAARPAPAAAQAPESRPESRPLLRKT